MAGDATLKDCIRHAERTLKLWHRVCDELDEGKSWKKINNGFRDGPCKVSMAAWEGYMRQRMYHHLGEICSVYRHEMKHKS